MPLESENKSVAYDHSRKAGNLGDVWKHSVLVALVDAVSGNSASFRYVECHAGAPIHELTARGEWTRGVGKIARRASRDSTWASIASTCLAKNQYPASWVFVARRLSRRFAHVKMVLVDHADHVAAQYPPPPDARIPSNVRVYFRQEDGYDVAERLEDADLVFLDPPYHPDAKKDWRRLGEVCRALALRQISFVAWYPFYWPTRPQRLSDFTKCEAWEVTWVQPGPRPSQNLKGCGMLVSDELAACLPGFEEHLGKVAAYMNSHIVKRRPARS